ncbi:MAG: signal peptide peptidase SppA [Rhodospirillales bacterium]|nr:signal peptide peptidase SppA [Rhodospirillales bacterium]
MHLQGDYALDRRRLKRRLTTWRVLAVVAAVIAVVAALAPMGYLISRPHLARVAIEGVITEDRERDRALADLADDSSVEALVVHIDSPGGTVVGGETLYLRLRSIADRKPVVAVLGGLGTSAAYMTALGSDHIIARAGTITGSIGVILQTAEVTDLLNDVGIKAETIKSGPLKAQPNPLEPLTPAAREAVEASVMDIYEMFVAMVGERRSLDRSAVMSLADGRVYTGRQALDNGLIDEIGGEEEARAWLQRTHDVGTFLPIRDVDLEGADRTLFDMLRTSVRKLFLSEILSLDGLVSVWHPK